MTEIIQLTQQSNGVGIITFNRPQALNALNIASMRAFQTIVSDLHNNAELRVLILTGAGQKAFCSGGDLMELSQHPEEQAARDFIGVMGDALLALERLPIPVIAAINGYALGGGSEIALACDMRIADEKVKIGLVQVNMALTPGWGAGQRLLRVVGYAKAMELLLRGDVLRADDLMRLKLINTVAQEGQALTAALEFANAIADRSPELIRSIKALLQAGLTQSYESALDTERDLFPALWADEPHLQAVENFLQRQDAKKNKD